MTNFLRHLKANAVAYLALFVALGGTSYAALQIPAGSVGARQLENHSIAPIKFDRSQIGAYVRYWAEISAQGTVVASRPSAHLVGWHDVPSGALAGGLVSWNQRLPQGCFALATTGGQFSPSYASADLSFSSEKRFSGVYVSLSTSQAPVSVAVFCREP
jgi:hypothetical protein